MKWCAPLGLSGAPLGLSGSPLGLNSIFIVQPAELANDPSHTLQLQGLPRAIYTFAPLGLSGVPLG